VSKTAMLESVRRLDLATTRALLEAKPALLDVVDRQERNLLHIACSSLPGTVKVSESHQARFVDFLLDRGLAIDLPVGNDACTPLFFAVARARNPVLVRRLIKRGADAAAAPGGGLFAAGWWDDVVNLKFLIKAGSPLDTVVGVTPFLACWLWKRFEAAKVLAKSGANVNYQDSKGRTALYHGVERQYEPELLQWLVAHGASPDIANREGVSARLMASRKRDKRYLTALTKNG
jgi:hypothetical protein